MGWPSGGAQEIGRCAEEGFWADLSGQQHVLEGDRAQLQVTESLLTQRHALQKDWGEKQGLRVGGQ